MSSQNSEFAKLENELIELRGKLEMAQLHMEQLQNSSSSGAAAAAGALDQSATATQIEGLLNEKAQLETKLEQVRARIFHDFLYLHSFKKMWLTYADWHT